jgi:hypothetical protein
VGEGEEAKGTGDRAEEARCVAVDVREVQRVEAWEPVERVEAETVQVQVTQKGKRPARGQGASPNPEADETDVALDSGPEVGQLSVVAVAEGEIEDGGGRCGAMAAEKVGERADGDSGEMPMLNASVGGEMPSDALELGVRPAVDDRIEVRHKGDLAGATREDEGEGVPGRRSTVRKAVERADRVPSQLGGESVQLEGDLGDDVRARQEMREELVLAFVLFRERVSGHVSRSQGLCRGVDACRAAGRVLSAGSQVALAISFAAQRGKHVVALADAASMPSAGAEADSQDIVVSAREAVLSMWAAVLLERAAPAGL